MNRELLIGILLFIGIVATIWIYQKENPCPCRERVSYENINVNDDIGLEKLFAPPDSQELTSVIHDWEKFDLQSEDFEVIRSFNYLANRKIDILFHTNNGKKHYGAIIFPKGFDEKKTYPLLAWVNGLNQRDPTVNIGNSYFRKIVSRLPEYFVILPSFRGQALEVNKDRFCSDGFFGDAYDGATDDALRLLKLAQEQYKGIDVHRIGVYGGSRGGTVALLMAIRNPSINTIVAQTGPVKFHWETAYRKYLTQFKYQFLNEKKPISELRKKMIESSPVYFIEKSKTPMLLLYGKKDRIVDIENLNMVIAKVEGKENFHYRISDTGHSFDVSKDVVEWMEMHNQ